MKLKAILRHPHILPYCKTQACSKISKMEQLHLHLYAVSTPLRVKYINKTPTLNVFYIF